MGAGSRQYCRYTKSPKVFTLLKEIWESPRVNENLTSVGFEPTTFGLDLPIFFRVCSERSLKFKWTIKVEDETTLRAAVVAERALNSNKPIRVENETTLGVAAVADRWALLDKGKLANQIVRLAAIHRKKRDGGCTFCHNTLQTKLGTEHIERYGLMAVVPILVALLLSSLNDLQFFFVFLYALLQFFYSIICKCTGRHHFPYGGLWFKVIPLK